MDTAEAQAILDDRLSTFAHRPYSEVAAMVDRRETATVKAQSGTEYQLEFNVFYDDAAARSNLRIIGSIDDGGWRAYLPLTKTLIMSPAGKLL